MVLAAALTQVHPSFGRDASAAVIVDFSAIDEAIAARRALEAADAAPSPREAGESERPLGPPALAAPDAGAPSLPPPGSASFYSLFPPPPPVSADAPSGEPGPSGANEPLPAEEPLPATSLGVLPVARPVMPARPRFAPAAPRRPVLQRAALDGMRLPVRRLRPVVRPAAAFSAVVAPAAKPLRPQDGENRAVRLRLRYAAWQTQLSPAAMADLEALALDVGGDDQIRIRLAAYADAGDGSVAKARRTSLVRALAVRGFLIERGIKAGRIDLRALGHTTAAAEADRVDVVVAGK